MKCSWVVLSTIVALVRESNKALGVIRDQSRDHRSVAALLQRTRFKLVCKPDGRGVVCGATDIPMVVHVETWSHRVGTLCVPCASVRYLVERQDNLLYMLRRGVTEGTLSLATEINDCNKFY